MINQSDLRNYLDTLLNVASFKDYCPNGLQIEGRKSIKRIISGVSANLALIEAAVKEDADTIICHHGLFWKNTPQSITGAMRTKIALLLMQRINLFAYHLPLDAHEHLGNNIQLAKKLGICHAKPISRSLLWQGKLGGINMLDFEKRIESALQRKPLVCGAKKQKLDNIIWCTGAAQSYLHQAIAMGADVYLSGEISEQTPYTASENNISYISAGHHATERYGVQALSAHLARRFDLQNQFIEIDNTV